MEPKQPYLDQALEQAISLFKQGRLPEAAKLCGRLLSQTGNHPLLHNLMAAILAKQGQGQAAVSHWEKALAKDPGMIPARLNLARHLRRAGLGRESLAHFQKAMDLAPGNLETRKELASLLMDASRHGEALKHLDLALESAPNDPPLLNARAGCLGSLGRTEEALQQYEVLLQAVPGYWQAIYNHALLLSKHGRHQETSRQCEMLFRLVPDFGPGLALWAESLLRLEHFTRASEILKRCLELLPESAPLHSMSGVALMRLGRLEQAEGAFRRSLQIDPGQAGANQNLAALLSQSLRYEEALEPALAGLDLVPDSIDLALIASKCLLKTQGAEKAESFLDDFLAGRRDDPAPIPPDRLGDLHLELADLKDRMGKSRETFEHTLAGNRQKAGLIQTWLPGAELFKAQIAELKSLYLAGKLEITKPIDDEGSVAPVFLVGFPRSGTTLFKQILDSHSRISALDEKPGFQYVREAMARELSGGFPGGLAEMGRSEKERYARMYREDVSRRAHAGPGVTILDKSPLDLVFAGPLNLLFPNAKLILMARHPLDACLSCFMRNFTLQERTVDFTALESTVALYEMAFDLWRVYTEPGGLDYHLIRYEDLVADMPGRTGAVLDYLGLPWEQAVLDYRGGIKNNGQVASISHHQVAEPIYNRAKFRWQRYTEFLEPFMPRLAPYCRLLGYGDPRP